MGDKEYMTVKEVAELLETEAYVLRFYEKELNLVIERNSKGHRMYSMKDIELLKKIIDMRGRGLQLKAIEGIVNSPNTEAMETYEQLSSVQLAPVTALKAVSKQQVDITNMSDERVQVFTGLMKNMLSQVLDERGVYDKQEMEASIKHHVDEAVDEKLKAFKKGEEDRKEAYYRQLDEAMREVQKMRREMSEDKEEDKKVKASLWNRLFKGKNEQANL